MNENKTEELSYERLYGELYATLHTLQLIEIDQGKSKALGAAINLLININKVLTPTEESDTKTNEEENGKKHPRGSRENVSEIDTEKAPKGNDTGNQYKFNIFYEDCVNGASTLDNVVQKFMRVNKLNKSQLTKMIPMSYTTLFKTLIDPSSASPNVIKRITTALQVPENIISIINDAKKPQKFNDLSALPDINREQ